MTTAVDEPERRTWIEIDYAAGIALCIIAGLTFAAAVSSWIFIFSDLSDLRSRLESVRNERTSQISDVSNALQLLELRIEAVSSKLDQVEEMSRPSDHVADPRERKIQNLEAILGRQKAREKQRSGAQQEK